MLVFVVPLKSRQTALDWPRTCRLFERTLRSICGQTSPAFHVIVVCHERPELSYSHPNVRYLEVAFPPPEPTRQARLMDRRRKELTAFLAARAFGRCHILKADADDCVSNRLAAFVREHHDEHGWFVDRGYVYFDGGDRIRLKRRRFFTWCGTSGIVSSDCLDLVTSDVAEVPSEYDAFERLDTRYYIPHMDLPQAMAARGTPLAALPFPGAIYVVGHGENCGVFRSEDIFLSRFPVVRAIRRIVSLQEISPQIEREFGLYPLTPAT